MGIRGQKAALVGPDGVARAVLGTLLRGLWGLSAQRSQARSPRRKCLPPGSHQALPLGSPSPNPGVNTSLLCLAVELDRALGHQEPHWKEFRFDLTQIPAGETVTAAEFRIYKLPSTHPLNRTLHVSMFEVVRERANRCLPRPASRSGLCRCVWPSLVGNSSKRTEWGFLGAHPSDEGCLSQGPGALASSHLPAVLAVGPWTGR